MVIDADGHIEVDDSDNEYSEEIDELFDDYEPNSRKRKNSSVVIQSKKTKSSESVSKANTLRFDLCNVTSQEKTT